MDAAMKNRMMMDCINRALKVKNRGESFINTLIPFCSIHVKVANDYTKTYELLFSGLADWDYEMSVPLERMDYDYVVDAIKKYLVIFMKEWAEKLIKRELLEEEEE